MRRFARGRASALADRARVLVLCPIRRELQLGLFTSARDSFVDAGFPVSAVRRFQGIDLQNNRQRDGVQSASAVVTMSFLRGFVPKARAIWRTSLGVLYVLFFFAEDDCRFLPAVDVQAVLREAKAAGRCAGCLGYGWRNGQPRGGAHLLSFTKAGLERLVKRTLNPCKAEGAGLGHGIASSLAGGQNFLPAESLAQQASHPLKRRR